MLITNYEREVRSVRCAYSGVVSSHRATLFASRALAMEMGGDVFNDWRGVVFTRSCCLCDALGVKD